MKKELLLLSFIFMMMAFPFCAQAQNKGYEKSIELNGGIPIDKYSKYSLGITMMNGYRFNDFFYLGAGVGYEYFNALYYTSYDYIGKGHSDRYNSFNGKNMLRIFARVKANLTKTKVSPYFAGDIGYTIDFNANDCGSTTGLMFEPQFGIDFKLPEKIGLYFAVGYRGQQNSYTRYDLTYGDIGSTKEKVLPGLVDIKFGIKF